MSVISELRSLLASLQPETARRQVRGELYTHYYCGLGARDPEKWQAIFPDLVGDTWELIQAFGADRIGGPDGEGGAPTLTKDEIAFNGVDKESHEAFHIRRDGKCWMGFTKTAQKYYDDVVTAVLIRACFRLGKDSKDIGSIRSDGDWAEWIDGRKLVKKVFPDDQVVKPPGVSGQDIEDEAENQKKVEA